MAKLDFSDFVVTQDILLEGGLCSNSGNKERVIKAVLLREEVVLITKDFITLEERIELAVWWEEVNLTLYKIN